MSIQLAIRQPTLADRLTPNVDARWRDAALVIGASLLVALSAKISVMLPFSPVPVTGQTFAVLLVGAVLGWRRGSAALALYLAQGAAGLPVFAQSPSSIATLLGPTGGYLLAFPLAAALTGFLAERGWDRRFGTMLLVMLAGNAVIYALGLIWLSVFVPRALLLETGLLPFLAGDVAKAILATLLLPTIWRWVGRR